MPSCLEEGGPSTQSRRPGTFARQPSNSYVCQSPPDRDTPSTSYRPTTTARPQKHVVGKLGRNVSFGKNPSKPTAATDDNGGEAGARHPSDGAGGVGNTYAPSSPRPGMIKRNNSNMPVKRSTPNAVLRKNHSSGHLPRQGSSKNLSRPPMKRVHSHGGVMKTQQTLATSLRSQKSPLQPTVRFDVGDEEGQDDDWTEDSASQSPETTRANTRSNSMILGDVSRDMIQNIYGSGLRGSRPPNARLPSDTVVRFAQPADSSPPHSAQHHSLSDSSSSNRALEANVSPADGLHQPPDANVLTLRLLHRTSSQGAVAPQTSTVSAVGQGERRQPLSQPSTYGGSTLNGTPYTGTPGRDLVSRFIGEGSMSSGNTPDDTSLAAQRPGVEAADTEEDDEEDESVSKALSKRNKSTPNMTAKSSAGKLHRSTSSTRQAIDLELYPSRTQQKLELQRQSSNIEPQKMMPAILPRSAGRPPIATGISYASSADGGRLDPRIQSRFDQAQAEYRAIRRYQNPLVESVKKLGKIDGARKEWENSTKSSLALTSTSGNGNANGARTLLGQSSRASTTGSAKASGSATPARAGAVEGERAEMASRRSRVSFEVPPTARREREGDHDGEGSDASDGRSATTTSSRDEAYDLCMRLWDWPAHDGA